MGAVWREERVKSPHARTKGRQLQDEVTDVSYLSIRWFYPKRQPEGWYIVINNPPELGNSVLPETHYLLRDALRVAKAWWKQNGEAHMRQFK